MQNVATSIFYARLFAGIYDALPAAFFSYLPIHLLRCFFLSRHHTHGSSRSRPPPLAPSLFFLLRSAHGALSRFARFFSFSPAALLLLPALACIPREASPVVLTLPLSPSLSLARQTWTCCFLLDVAFSPFDGFSRVFGLPFVLLPCSFG